MGLVQIDAGTGPLVKVGIDAANHEHGFFTHRRPGIAFIDLLELIDDRLPMVSENSLGGLVQDLIGLS